MKTQTTPILAKLRIGASVVLAVVSLAMNAASGQICLNAQQQVPSGVGATTVVTCDVNGDGDLDLISPNPAGNTVLVLSPKLASEMFTLSMIST